MGAGKVWLHGGADCVEFCARDGIPGLQGVDDIQALDVCLVIADAV